jgi:hypothetical protein
MLHSPMTIGLRLRRSVAVGGGFPLWQSASGLTDLEAAFAHGDWSASASVRCGERSMSRVQIPSLSNRQVA